MTTNQMMMCVPFILWAPRGGLAYHMFKCSLVPLDFSSSSLLFVDVDFELALKQFGIALIKIVESPNSQLSRVFLEG